MAAECRLAHTSVLTLHLARRCKLHGPQSQRDAITDVDAAGKRAFEAGAPRLKLGPLLALEPLVLARLGARAEAHDTLHVEHAVQALALQAVVIVCSDFWHVVHVLARQHI